jgi:hypothetical protein
MRRATLLLAVVAALAVSAMVVGRLATFVDAQDTAQTAMAGHPLVGTWVVVDQRDTTDAPSLTVFSADGIVLDASAAGKVGAGSWEATGPRSGAATFVYVFEGPGGNYRANVVIRAALEVDEPGNAFTARYSYTETAPDGTVVRSLDSVANGVRIPVEPVEAAGSPLAGFPTVAVPSSGTPTP